MALVDAHERDGALVGPEAAAIHVEEEERIGTLGSCRYQHAVEQAERMVVQREVEDEQAEDAEADHGAVDRGTGENIDRLPDGRDDNAYQDDAVALGADARGPYHLDEEDDDHRGDDGVIEDAVERLAGIGDQAEVGGAVRHDLLDAERVPGEDVGKELQHIEQDQSAHGDAERLRRGDEAVLFREPQQPQHRHVHADEVDVKANGG